MEDKWVFGIWALCGAAILAFAMSIQAYYINKTELIAEMVAAGNDPVRVACSLDSDVASSPVCVLEVSK
jgi:hypothetical protein